jgi:hypothetical protein
MRFTGHSRILVLKMEAHSCHPSGTKSLEVAQRFWKICGPLTSKKKLEDNFYTYDQMHKNVRAFLTQKTKRTNLKAFWHPELKAEVCIKNVQNFLKKPTNALGCVNAIILHSNHWNVSAIHVAIFRVTTRRIEMKLCVHCILVLKTLKMATWVAETCRRLSCNKTTFIHPSAFFLSF